MNRNFGNVMAGLAAAHAGLNRAIMGAGEGPVAAPPAERKEGEEAVKRGRGRPPKSDGEQSA